MSAFNGPPRGRSQKGAEMGKGKNAGQKTAGLKENDLPLEAYEVLTQIMIFLQAIDDECGERSAADEYNGAVDRRVI